MAKELALRITAATDLWATVRELRQVVSLPMASITAAVKQQSPIPLPWPRDRWAAAKPLEDLGAELMALLERFAALGATVEIVIDGEPFGRDGLVGRLARARLDTLGGTYSHLGDPDLFHIASNAAPDERKLAFSELHQRLRERHVEDRELLWTAVSPHASQVRRSLAQVELALRGVDIASRWKAVGPCPHPGWKPVSDRYHACACCALQEKHDGKVAMDARGWGHGCSKCGYFEPD